MEIDAADDPRRGLAADQYPLALPFTAQLATASRHLTRLHLRFSQFIAPVWDQHTVRRTGDRVFRHGFAGTEKAADKVVRIAWGRDAHHFVERRIA